MNSLRNADRVQAADRVGVLIRHTDLCMECQEGCWRVAITLHGRYAEEDYTTHALTVQHLEQGQAMTLASKWLMGVGSVLTSREEHAWFLEHQPSLPLG